jgi:predicted nucleic acid-binding protein
METNRVLIETTVVIDYLRTRDRKVTIFEKAIEKYEKCFLSSITAYEVEFGAIRAGRLSDIAEII